MRASDWRRLLGRRPCQRHIAANDAAGAHRDVGRDERGRTHVVRALGFAELVAEQQLAEGA